MTFLNEKLKEEVYMMQPEGFTSTDESKCADSISPSMDLSKHLKVEINILIDVSKTYGFIKNGEAPYINKWANGSIVIFFVLYVDDILLIGNDIPAL